MPPKPTAGRGTLASTRFPPTAKRGRPLDVGRGRLSRGDQEDRSTAKRRKEVFGAQDPDDSNTTTSSEGNGRFDWTRTERILLDRTLHLHSVSPLHFSSLPGSIRDVSPALFRMLRAELDQYVNLRLSDGLGFLEGANTIANARDSSSGDLRPPARRRRADMGKVGKVRIAYLEDDEFLEGFDWSPNDQERGDGTRPWIIEMELGLPVENEAAGPSRGAATEARSAELCHIIFLPVRSAPKAGLNSHSYPLILTKAPSAAVVADQLMLASSNVGRLVLTHVLEWLQKRFDCRISSGSGAMSIASMLKGSHLEALAEIVVSQTRTLYGATDGATRSAMQKRLDGLVKPVELSFRFPSKVDDPCGHRGEKVPGPAPELSILTMTAPWEICMQLLEGLPEGQPLLPALNHYLSMQTSIPLDMLELLRIGVAGVNLGVGVGSVRLKVSPVPSESDLDPANKNAKNRDQVAVQEGDKRRAGIVFGFLRDLADKRRD